MENTQINNLKKLSNKFLIMSIIALVVTFILGLVFIFSINSDFTATKTIWGEMTSNVDGNNPGDAEYMGLALFLSGLTFFGELGVILIFIFLIFLVPFFANSFFLIINTVSRLFQIGKTKKWKNTISKILLYSSTVLQGILNIYLLLLCFTGVGIIYILLYLMFIINVICFIKNIINLKNS